MSPLLIRPSTPADLPALVSLQNAASPDDPTTLAMQEFREQTRRPELPFGRLVAERAGAVVGVGFYMQPEWLEGDHSLFVSVVAHPDARGQGVGEALYDALRAEMQPHQPAKLSTWVREDRPAALRFAANREFVEVAREQDMELDLRTLNLSQREQSFATARATGYELKTFVDVIAQVGADAAWQKYHALDMDAGRDVPLPPGESMAIPTLERYRERAEGNPEFDASLWFVADRDGELAALSQLWNSPVPGRMDTGFTGVARAHRGHRLAWALKYLVLEEAMRRGATHVRTTNDETNLPMRNINIGLGFVPIPAYLIMSLTLQP